MFSNIFFLILVLLMINISSENAVFGGIGSSWSAFLFSLVIYKGLLGLIVVQNFGLGRKLYRYKETLLKIVNIELILFLTLYHFIFDGNRLLDSYSPILSQLFSLALYFNGLAAFHFSLYQVLRIPYARSGWAYVGLQLRLLLPFVIPFLLLSFVIDFTQFFTSQVSILFMIVSILLIFFFLPPLIQVIWKCEPLKNSELKERLEAFCRRAKFRHAGMTTWSVLDHSLTAGIIGVLPRFRYVMFSKRLTEELPYEQIEAILAHEIGHSHRSHLLIYPFIIAGMILIASLFIFILTEMLNPFFISETVYLFINFFSYVGIMALYFRFVFGFYSRLLERQADLHIFTLGVPAEHLIAAFNSVAASTGTYEIPSWHHFSIKERVEFITSAVENPKLIQDHHQKVRKHLIFFFSLLFLMLLFFIFPETKF